MTDFLEQLKKNQHAREERGELGPYERMRESAESLDREIWADWRSGDRWRKGVYEQYERIRADQDLSLEGRAAKEQQAYERGVALATKAWNRARARAKQLAKENEGRAIPMPSGRPLFSSPVKDATTMVAIQGEAERIAASISSRSLKQLTKEVSKNSNDKGIQEAGAHTLGALRREFSAAMQAGGVEGEIRARGVLRVAEATNTPFDVVAGDHLEQKHLDAAEAASRFNTYASAIPTERQIPKPTPPPMERKVPGDYGRSNKLVLGGRDRKTAFGGKRRPTWK
jgi:hypothetical protein